jgi:hypothetical protein
MNEHIETLEYELSLTPEHSIIAKALRAAIDLMRAQPKDEAAEGEHCLSVVKPMMRKDDPLLATGTRSMWISLVSCQRAFAYAEGHKEGFDQGYMAGNGAMISAELDARECPHGALCCQSEPCIGPSSVEVHARLEELEAKLAALRATMDLVLRKTDTGQVYADELGPLICKALEVSK